MTLDTKPNNDSPAGRDAASSAPSLDARPRRTPLPLALVGFLVIAPAAYFLGRGSAARGPTMGQTASATAESEHAGEEHDHEAGHEQGEEGEEHGLIKLDSQAQKTAGIRVQPARRAPLAQTLTVPGTVEVIPHRSAKITPPAAGKLVRLLVSRGDTVRAGQPLAVLDSAEVAQAHAAVRQAESGVRQAQAQVQTARAQVQQAQNRLRSAQTALQGQRQLAQAGVFSQPSLQAAQAGVAEAEAELLQAQTERQSHVTVLRRAERLFQEELIARAELEQAQTEQRQDQTRVEQAQRRLAAAEQTLARERRLAQGGLLSRQALQAGEADVRAAGGDVGRALREEQAAHTTLGAARAAVAAAESNLQAVEGDGHTEGGGGRLTLYAPIGGVVTEQNATIGQVVERGTELLDIQDLSVVLVSAGVPERDVARVGAGLPVAVAVAAYPGTRFRGVVQNLASQVNEKTRTLPVRVRVDNRDGRLRPQMFAQVVLPVGPWAQALVVPASALAEEGTERFVFVSEDGGFERRPVQVGRAFGDTVEITGGLEAGDPVVVEGVFVLRSELVKAELKGHAH